MNAPCEIDDEPLLERQPTLVFTCVAIVVMSFLFFSLGNDWRSPLTADDQFQQDEADIEEQAEFGNNLWRLAFVFIGMAGCLFLLYPGGRKISFRQNALSAVILLAIGWALLSILWAEVPALALRRTVGLLCIFVGSLGIAKHFSATRVCILVLVYGICILGAGIAAELAHGTLTPFDTAYRFAGTGHPNQTAIRMALLSVTAITLARHYSKWRIVLLPLFCAAMTVLFLTKSRASLASVLIALFAIWTLDASTKFKIVTSAAVTMSTLGFLIVIFNFGNIRMDSVTDVLLLGRESDDATTFTGRVPLWEFALRDIAERPILGYGFNAYWTDEKLAEAHYELGWALPDAHNAYLETTLSIGIIGLLLVMAVVLIGTWAVAHGRNRTRDHGLTCVFGICVFGLLNGFFESHMLQPFNFSPFVISCVFCRLAFFPHPVYQPTAEPAPTEYSAADVV